MRRVLLAVAIGVTLSAAPARADSMVVANELGTILGSEEYCGLSLNQAGIEAYIEKRVRADDTQFAPMLNMMTEGTKVELRDQSPASKVAHCAQVRRSAKAHSLLN
ncbi:MAG: signal recognition particle [Rhizobiales bacterium]|nr:signal recognition particle [Hyphomicrobiales bacterium]OJY06657.1 MAG: hypothetical protein BGP07_16565 [Rhizobiales bacterium 63-22]